jgi:mono/diheme cytochrome c family protein
VNVLKPIRTAARMLYVSLAWLLLGLVFTQVFHAGTAILVNSGNWAPHTNLGHLFSLPILLMIPLSLIGWMGWRYLAGSLGLFVLYILQYVFLHAFSGGALTALHPVNALVIAGTALWLGRSGWQLVTERFTPGQRGALAAFVGALTLAGVLVASGAGTWPGEADGDRNAAAPSLAAATEADVPAEYKSVQIPTGAEAVQAGRQIAEKRCIACHAADFQGKQIGANQSADLTQSAANRSEQFLLWALSEGSQRGMPAQKALPEAQRLQLVAFIKSLR